MFELTVKQVWYSFGFSPEVLEESDWQLDCHSLPNPRHFWVIYGDDVLLGVAYPDETGAWQLMVGLGEPEHPDICADLATSSAQWNEVLLLSIDRDEAEDELGERGLAYLVRDELSMDGLFDAGPHVWLSETPLLNGAYMQEGMTDVDTLFGHDIAELKELYEPEKRTIDSALLEAMSFNFDSELDAMLLVAASVR